MNTMIARTHVSPRVNYATQLHQGNFVHSSIGGRQTLHRSILFLSVAGVTMVIGCVCTGLGYHSMPNGHMTGPILMALSLLLLLFAIREYFVFRQHKLEIRRVQFQTTGIGALAALSINRNDQLGTITLVMDTIPERDHLETNLDSVALPELSLPTYMQATELYDVPPPNDSPHSDNLLDKLAEKPPSYEEAIQGFISNINQSCEGVSRGFESDVNQSNRLEAGFPSSDRVEQSATVVTDTDVDSDVDNNNTDGNNNTGENLNTPD